MRAIHEDMRKRTAIYVIPKFFGNSGTWKYQFVKGLRGVLFEKNTHRFSPFLMRKGGEATRSPEPSGYAAIGCWVLD
ncbi:hypothetical protein MTBSS4_110032 [Magnetospirillum sp. SS-4]|nr:hypothetical protein MTBSS4_110032 [Magnetospirillum sp. SS-4]